MGERAVKFVQTILLHVLLFLAAGSILERNPLQLVPVTGQSLPLSIVAPVNRIRPRLVRGKCVYLGRLYDPGATIREETFDKCIALKCGRNVKLHHQLNSKCLQAKTGDVDVDRSPTPVANLGKMVLSVDDAEHELERSCIYEGVTYAAGETIRISTDFCNTLTCHPLGQDLIETINPRCIGVDQSELSSPTEPPLIVSKLQVAGVVNTSPGSNTSTELQTEDGVKCSYGGRQYRAFDIIYTSDDQCVTIKCLSSGRVALAEFCHPDDRHTALPAPVRRRRPGRASNTPVISRADSNHCQYRGNLHDSGTKILSINQCYSVWCNNRGRPVLRTEPHCTNLF